MVKLLVAFRNCANVPNNELQRGIRITTCMYECVYVCMFVCEREGEKEREREIQGRVSTLVLVRRFLDYRGGNIYFGSRNRGSHVDDNQ
jgi:hypothetical protein